MSGGGDRIIGSAEELQAALDALLAAPVVDEAFAAFAMSGRTALFWMAYQRERQERGTPSDDVLRVLDSVVERLLNARTDAEIVKATGLGRPHAGPGEPARAATTLETCQLCWAIWAAALVADGKHEADGHPPARIPNGVYRDIALQHFGTDDDRTQRNLRRRWSRWRSSPQRDAAADLQGVMAAMARVVTSQTD